MKTRKMINIFDESNGGRGRCRIREKALNGFADNCVGIRKNAAGAVLKYARFRRSDGTFRNYYFVTGRI